VMPDTVLCRVVGLQFGLQTLFTGDVCLHRQSGPLIPACVKTDSLGIPADRER
jgi:hypothetical protein